NQLEHRRRMYDAKWTRAIYEPPKKPTWGSPYHYRPVGGHRHSQQPPQPGSRREGSGAGQPAADANRVGPSHSLPHLAAGHRVVGVRVEGLSATAHRGVEDVHRERQKRSPAGGPGLAKAAEGAGGQTIG